MAFQQAVTIKYSNCLFNWELKNWFPLHLKDNLTERSQIKVFPTFLHPPSKVNVINIEKNLQNAQFFKLEKHMSRYEKNALQYLFTLHLRIDNKKSAWINWRMSKKILRQRQIALKSIVCEIKIKRSKPILF